MLPLQAKAMAIAPFAAISLDRFKDIGKSARKLYDRIYYGEVLPPVGAAEMSYARLLEHLENKTVKRIVLLADSRYALVEVSYVPCWHEAFGKRLATHHHQLNFSWMSRSMRRNILQDIHFAVTASSNCCCTEPDKLDLDGLSKPAA